MEGASDPRPLEAAYCIAMAGLDAGAGAKSLACELPRFLDRNWQIQPLIYAALTPVGGGSDAWRRFADSSIAIEAFSSVQLTALGECCDALEAAGIRYALLKSSAVRLKVYADPVHRTGWDIDIAVERDALPCAADALQRIGFRFAQFNPQTRRFAPADPRLRAEVEAEHYELGFLVRRSRVKGLSARQVQAIRRTLGGSRHWHLDDDEQLCCYTTVDVHHGLSLEVSTSELLKSACPLPWNGRQVWLPSLPWLAFHVVYKLYWEGVHAYGKGLYQYADVCRLVQRMTDAEAEGLILLLESANLRSAAFFVLRRLPTAFRTALPTPLEKYVSECGKPEGEDPIACNDLGDMWDKLWGRR